jgi:uncharacterized protein YbaR (Trm112 family)/SAM-dependent methyltransferase
MKINQTDYVLEIGSGNNPRPRSDILCDRWIEDDMERGGNIVRDRPIIEADAQDLPFRDSAFDYVICAQVLEHVDDPERMLRELMRVASRGYIETPTEVAEWLYGWPFHRSVVNLLDGKLVIRRKDFTPPFGELFHVLSERDQTFRRFHLTHNRLLMVQYEWEGRIDYEILPSGTSALDLRSPEVVERLVRDIAGASLKDRWMPALKSLIPRSVAAWGKSSLARARPRQRRDLRDIIVCPRCKGPVVWESQQISCSRCSIEYPITRGIPRLSFQESPTDTATAGK